MTPPLRPAQPINLNADIYKATMQAEIAQLPIDRIHHRALVAVLEARLTS